MARGGLRAARARLDCGMDMMERGMDTSIEERGCVSAWGAVAFELESWDPRARGGALRSRGAAGRVGGSCTLVAGVHMSGSTSARIVGVGSWRARGRMHACGRGWSASAWRMVLMRVYGVGGAGARVAEDERWVGRGEGDGEGVTAHEMTR